MKCRLTKFLSTSSLRCFLFALCCLLLCLGFGSFPANALTKIEFGTVNVSTGTDITIRSSQRIAAGYYYYILGNTSNYNGYGNVSLGVNLSQTGISADQLITVNFAVSYSTADNNGTTSGSNINLDITPICPAYVSLSGYEATVETCNIANLTPLTIRSNNGATTTTNSSKTYAVYNYTLQIRPVSTSNIQLKDIYFGKIAGLYSQGHNIGMTVYFGASQIDYRPNPVVEAIKDSADQAHKDSQAQQDAINNQTKQEQDQYDQEKQEEQEREESAKNDGNGLLGIFNITILNPFAGIWEMFNSGGCTSIPTIAGWIGSEDTTYCSWWPQSIRATLTPVFSLASMMLLFGFVARWLGGSEGINVKVSEY